MADAVMLDAQYTAAYYNDSDGTCSEKYITVHSYPTASLGSDLTVYLDYPDASVNVTFLTLEFTFSKEELINSQSYRLSFSSNWRSTSQYTYGYFFDCNFAAIMGCGTLTIEECKNIGDSNIYPNQFNSYFVNKVTQAYEFVDEYYSNLAPFTGRVTESTPFSVEINIPSDYTNRNEVYGKPLSVYYYLILVNHQYLNNFILQDLSLEPIGQTRFLYADKEFQNDVIGSDQEGEESGIKGILKKIKEIPQKIGESLTELGNKIIQGIKDLFIPTEDQINTFKSDVELLLSEHLGVIYDAPNLMVQFLQQLADFKPLRSDNMSDYYIEFPSKDLFINTDTEQSIDIISSEDNQGVHIPFIPDNTGQGTYKMSFAWLGEQPFKTFYGIYEAFIIFITIIGFCSYCIRKYERVIGG